jgi:hypothetical protein
MRHANWVRVNQATADFFDRKRSTKLAIALGEPVTTRWW